MRYAILVLTMAAVCGCRSSPPSSPSIPPLAHEPPIEPPPPQVLLSPTDQPPLKDEPGSAMAPVSEEQRRKILEHQPPVFEPYKPAPVPVVVEQHRSVMDTVTQFPLFHTLAYAGLGAIIGNQFDGNNGAGAAIGAGIGFLQDTWESQYRNQSR